MYDKMYDRIHNGLNRQNKALALLLELLQEEYSLLLSRNVDAIVSLEFSVHELLRQIGSEKVEIINLLDGGKVRHYAELLPEEQGAPLLDLYMSIDEHEQECSRQASRNAEVSLILLGQSQRTLNELHNYIIPNNAQTYSKHGAMAHKRPQASYLSGRL